jgi:hypothetical protein
MEDMRKHLMVAALDFGTTYSGYAFSMQSEYKRYIFVFKKSLKIPKITGGKLLVVTAVVMSTTTWRR